MDLSDEAINILGMEGDIGSIYTTLFKIDGDFVRLRRIGSAAPGIKAVSSPEPNRVTFVLVHGIGLSSTYMLPLAEELQDVGQVFLFDLPGFGNLPVSHRSQDIPHLAGVLCKALSLTGVSNIVLVGHSMGAQIVVEMMAQNHDFTRACLIGPPVNAHERTLSWVLARYMQSAIHEKPDLVTVATWSYMRSVKTWLLNLLPNMLNYPIEKRISNINQDTQLSILGGEYDYLAPPYWLKELAHAAAGEAWIGRIPQAAHSTIYSNDNDVAYAIRRLLKAEEISAHRNSSAQQ